MASKRKFLHPRTPSGQLSHAGKQREFPPAQVKRLRDAAMRNMTDPRWGTELGRLYLESTITAEMYAAGLRWSEWADRYQKAIGVFPVRGIPLEGGSWSHEPDPDSPKGRKIADRETDLIERFFAAHAELVSAGVMVEYVVRKVCERNEQLVGYGELLKFRSGLSALAIFWGLDGQGKSTVTNR